jgi:hypothetical protein
MRVDNFFPRFADACALRPDAAVALVGGDNFPPLPDPGGVALAIEKFLAGLARRRRPARARRAVRR